MTGQSKIISVLLAAVVAFSSCVEKVSTTGNNAPRQTLLDWFDSIIEEQSADVPRKKVYIVSHRAQTRAGIDANLPENSIPMIEAAIEAGTDMVELDVRVTMDGTLILMHDEGIARTTTGTGLVANMTYNQILYYDMKRGSAVSENLKVPTLEEALLACKDKVYVNLDIYGKGIPVKTCVEVIERTGMTDQVMVFINREEAGQYYLENNEIALHPFIDDAGNIRQYYSEYYNAKLFQYETVMFMGSKPSLAKKVREAGCLTYSNVLEYDSSILSGDYGALDKFIASETDFIQTDYMEVVDAYLKNKGLR